MTTQPFRFQSSYRGESLYVHLPTGRHYVARHGDMGTLRHRYTDEPAVELADAWQAERRRQRDDHITYCERRGIPHLAHVYFDDVDRSAD